MVASGAHLPPGHVEHVLLVGEGGLPREHVHLEAQRRVRRDLRLLAPLVPVRVLGLDDELRHLAALHRLAAVVEAADDPPLGDGRVRVAEQELVVAVLLRPVARRVYLPAVEPAALDPAVVVDLGAEAIDRQAARLVARAHDALEHAAVAAHVQPLRARRVAWCGLVVGHGCASARQQQVAGRAWGEWWTVSRSHGRLPTQQAKVQGMPPTKQKRCHIGTV